MRTAPTFRRFDRAPELLGWVDSAAAAASEVLNDPDLDTSWRAGRTWFVGVDAIPNDGCGRIGGGPAPEGPAIDAARLLSDAPWHRMQLSTVRAGYPGSGRREDPVQHRFRLRRDGAHLDGLIAEGPGRRRHLREPHAFILGVALSEAEAGSCPLVVWEGSEIVMRDAFTAAFAGHPPGSWGDIDVTDIYTAARRDVFRRCERKPVPLRRGEAVLMHRLALHGIAPWKKTARAAPEGRLIAYLRPRAEPLAWLTAP